VRGAELGSLLGVTLAVSALANNPPASSIVAAGLVPGPAVYAALVAHSVGALATPRPLSPRRS
jgi:hypothetical protein